MFSVSQNYTVPDDVFAVVCRVSGDDILGLIFQGSGLFRGSDVPGFVGVGLISR